MRIARRSSLLAFGLSLVCTFTTASAVDFDSKSHLAVPGDFNGDGRMDVLMQPLEAGGKGAILLRDGTGQLSVTAQGWDPGYLGLDWSAKSTTLTAADFNGDGQDDVLVQPVKAGGTAAVLITDPTVQLLQISQLLPSGYLNFDWSSETHHAVAGDFDGDRHKELFMQATQRGGLGVVVHADESGHFVAITQTFVDGYLGRRWNSLDEKLYVGDFNGDGRQDLLVQSRGAVPGESAFALLLADGNGQFTSIAETWNLKDLGANWNPSTHKIIIEDANHDGIMDIVLQSTVSGGTSYVFEGNAQGLFTQPAAHWTGDKSASDVLNTKQSGSKTHGTGISIIPGGGGPSAKIITAPTNPEQNPTIPRGGQGYQGGGQIMTANAAGVLQGSGGVSGGTATYSVPIAVPPGIAGMQPSISLNYSSRGGNGEMGMGWSMSAGSQIHRCPATQAMDGYSTGVTYTVNANNITNDRLCLDGQHLIVVTGNYGTNGAVYRTELDSFARITETGDISSGTSYFIVDEKNGHELRYGYGTNIGASANAVFTPSGAPAPLAWGLGIELDTYQNSVIYYYSTFGAGEYLLTSIKYTGNGATAGNREVDFTYSARSDMSNQYLAGGLTTQSQILSTITTSENGAPVRTYSMDYAGSGATGRTLLAGVQECGGVGANQACLPETMFTWQQAAVSFKTTPTPIDVSDPCGQYAALPNAPSITLMGDINGDGYKDVYYYAPGCGSVGGTISSVYLMGPGGVLGAAIPTPASLNVVSSIVVDIDGDGRTDLVGFVTIQDPNNPNQTIDRLAYSTFDASTGQFDAPRQTVTPIQYNETITMPNGQPLSYSRVIAVQDVNGDGLPDVVVVIPDPNTPGNHMLAVYLNTTTPCTTPGCTPPVVTFSSTPIKMVSKPDYTDSSGNLTILRASTAGDLDGNGIQDFSITFTDSSGTSHGYWVFPLMDSQKHLSFMNLDGDGSAGPGIEMDINGDGLPDLVYTCGTVWCYQLNTGQIGPNMFAPIHITTVNDNRTPQQSAGTITADYDNDGRQELLFPNPTPLAEFCSEEVRLPDGEMVEECAYSTPHQLPPGEDHSVYQYYALKFEPQSDGAGGVQYVPTLINTNLVGQSQIAVPMDLQGDGLTGLISPFTTLYIDGRLKNQGTYTHPSGLNAVLNKLSSSDSLNAAPDLMLTAADGFGRQQQWDYYPLSSTHTSNSVPLYYSPGLNSTGYAGGDYFYFSSSMYVVGDYSASNGVGGLNTHDFHYAGAIYNNQGRGFQGFRTVVDDDMVSGARTVQVYHQRFPLSGTLLESWTTTQSGSFDLTNSNPQPDGNAIETVSDTWSCMQGGQTAVTVDGITCSSPLDANTYVPVLTESMDTHFDVTSHDTLSTIDTHYCAVSSGACTGFGYDLYGNSQGSVTMITDPYGTYTTSVSNAYGSADLAAWWLNKLTGKVTASTAVYGGIASPTIPPRTTTYDYYGDGTRGLNHVYATEDGQAANESTTHYTYANGNVTSAAVTGGTGLGAISRTTATTYSTGADANYFVQKVTDPAGLATTYTADPRFGSPATVQAPDGATTTNVYDVFGRTISSQVSSQATPIIQLPAQSIAYITAVSGDGMCDGTSTTSQYYVLTNQTGYPSHYECYDMLNRVIRSAHENLSTGSDLVMQSTYYDAHGRVSKVSEPHFSSTAALWNHTYYDDSNILGRVSNKTDAKGVTTSYTYNDLVTEIYTSAADSPTRQDEEIKNSLGKLITVTNAVGAPEQAATSYQYDSDGNPVTVMPADSHAITAVFDVLGHKISVTDPDQGTTGFTYDVAGDLISQTDAKSQTLAMTYDNDGRMLTKTSSVSGEPVVAWTYDSCTRGAGKLCSVSVADGSYAESYSYDSLGRATSDTENIGGVPYETDTSYDSDGRVNTVTYPDSIGDQPPVSEAGATQYVLPGAVVTLNGSASYDPDSGPQAIDYQWAQTAGPTVTLNGATTAGSTFTAGTTPGTNYTFTLTVDDGLSDNTNTDTNTVTVNVPALPAAPGGLTDNGDTDHDGNYVVAWNTVSVPGTSIVYHLEEATGTSSGPTGSWTEIYAGATNNDSVGHPGNGSYYYWYRVRAEDQLSGTSIGYGSYSSTDDIHVVVTPGAPSSISPTTGSTSTGTYTISWGAYTGSVKSADVFYELQESTTTGFTSVTTVYSGTARSDSISKGSLGDWYYRVRACNQDGSLKECSAWVARAHEIVTGTGGGGGQQQIIHAPGSGTTLAPVPITGGQVGMIMPAPHTTVEAMPEQKLALLLVPAAHRSATRSKMAYSRHVRPTYASPVYKAWANAKLQNATGGAPLTRFSVQYVYSPNGYLSQLVDGANPNRVYWWVNNSAYPSGGQDDAGEVVEHGMNAYGQVTDVFFGSGGLATHYSYDGTTDYLDRIHSTNGTTTYQDLNYAWESIGNLKTRASNPTVNNSNTLSEAFTYDLHNRLLSSTITNGSGTQTPVTYSYDSVGDLMNKSDVGAYTYGGGAGPHALTSVAGTVNGSYTYDSNGNMTSRAGTTISWNSDNLPTSITQDAGDSSVFSYAPDKHRYKQVAMNGGVSENTIYAGGVEIFTSGGVTHYRHTLSAYGRPVMQADLYTDTNNKPNQDISYLLTDHLGSLDTVVDGTTSVAASESFDSFGHRRDPSTWQPMSGGSTMPTKHGFTYHEHLDNVGLIHMNGRVYDPTVGRFLSVDPVYQAPTNSQSVNPYSYVMNNPLSLTDSTGYVAACYWNAECDIDGNEYFNQGNPESGGVSRRSYYGNGSVVGQRSDSGQHQDSNNGNEGDSSDKDQGQNQDQTDMDKSGDYWQMEYSSDGESVAYVLVDKTGKWAVDEPGTLAIQAKGTLTMDLTKFPKGAEFDALHSIDYVEKGGDSVYRQMAQEHFITVFSPESSARCGCASGGFDVHLNIESGHYERNQGGFGHIWFNFDEGLRVDGGVQTPALGAAHEADHALREYRDPDGFIRDKNTPESGTYHGRTGSGDIEEERVIRGSEFQTARKLGEPVRYWHSEGEPVHVDCPTCQR